MGTRLALRLLDYGWANPHWAASLEFLVAMVAAAEVAPDVVLECGSGLSTLVLAIVAERTGAQVISLEHNPEWARRTQDALARVGLRTARVIVAPLRDCGRFEWYDLANVTLPRGIPLVICDGPPGTTPGGRYGLLPQAREFLSDGCKILVDDAARPGEQEVLRHWRLEYPVTVEPRGIHKPFAIVTIASRTSDLLRTEPGGTRV